MFGFLKKNKDKPRAIVFVDYENWYITLDNFYKMRPDIRGWHDELFREYNVEDVLFFADFSNPALRSEISKIREVSNTIIETQSSRSYTQKDFTDFIMLDHIYQKALSSDQTDVFILVTGDGHFSSVVNFLRTKCRKKVIVYGADAATSNQLKKCANEFVSIPTERDICAHRKQLIISHIAQLYAEKSCPRILFGVTVNAVSKKYNVEPEKVKDLVHELVKEGALQSNKQYFKDGKFGKILNLNQEKAKELGYKV